MWGMSLLLRWSIAAGWGLLGLLWACGPNPTVSLAHNQGPVPWAEAVTQRFAHPDAAPEALMLGPLLDDELTLEQEFTRQTGQETLGGLYRRFGRLVLDRSTRRANYASIWHTHPEDTSLSATDVSGWLANDMIWETVRGASGHTYVGLRTEATPSSLHPDDLLREAGQLRYNVGRLMSDAEASHWTVFELSRRYHFVYYYAEPGSRVLQRVTTDGPFNVDVPKGYAVAMRSFKAPAYSAR